jgi:hypothetical protein
MSGRDHLRVESNERVDLGDFDYAVDDGLSASFENLVGQFLTSPEGQRAWILTGFAVDNSDGAPLGGTQVRSTKGRAILSRIEDGVVSHGVVSTQGDATKIIDIGAFSNDTYGVYIRFQFVDGDTESRAFWDSSSSEEFAQTIATRHKANWSMRIEATNPGEEWFKIAEVTVAAGVVSGLTDERDFYFEGDVEHTYPSGWSTDSDSDGTIDELPVVAISTDPTWPGGTGDTGVATTSDTSELAVGDFVRLDTDLRWYKVTAITPSTNFTFADVHGHGGTLPSGAGASSLQTHRSTNRADDGISDVQTFVAATRQCLEDIKGRGLRRWWERDIGGLNIGFDADPTEKRIAFGDADSYLDHASPGASSSVTLRFATGDALVYDRGTDELALTIGTTSKWIASATGVNIVDGGMAVGYAATPTADRISLGDATCYWDHDSPGAASTPHILWDTGDRLEFDRDDNAYEFYVATNKALDILATGACIEKGLVVGDATTIVPVDDGIKIRDDSFIIQGSSTAPSITFDNSGSSLAFTRSTSIWDWDIGSTLILQIGINPVGGTDGRLTLPTNSRLLLTPRSTPTNTSAGELYNNTSTKMLMGLTGGLIHARYVPQVSSRTADGGPVANTTTETSFGSGYTVKADTLIAGSVIRVRVAGSGGSTGSPSCVIRIRYGGVPGGVALAAVTTPTLTGSWEFSLDLMLTVRSAGASVAAKGEVYKAAANGSPVNLDAQPVSVTIDTTADKVIETSADWDTADALNTVTLTSEVMAIT